MFTVLGGSRGVCREKEMGGLHREVEEFYSV